MKKIIFTILTISAFITPSFAFAVSPHSGNAVWGDFEYNQPLYVNYSLAIKVSPDSGCDEDLNNEGETIFYGNPANRNSGTYTFSEQNITQPAGSYRGSYLCFYLQIDDWVREDSTAFVWASTGTPTPTPTPTPAGGFIIQLPDTGGLIASVSLATLGIFSDMTPIAMIIVGIILGLGLLTWVIARLPIKPEKTPWVDPDKHSL